MQNLHLCFGLFWFSGKEFYALTVPHVFTQCSYVYFPDNESNQLSQVGRFVINMCMLVFTHGWIRLFLWSRCIWLQLN